MPHLTQLLSCASETLVPLQVLLTSDVLEMTVGSCVSAPLAPEREERLRKMLNSVFTHPDSAHLVAPVAAGVIGLGQGLDSDAKDIVKVGALCRGQGILACQWWLCRWRNGF